MECDNLIAFAGGYCYGSLNTIDYITISTPSNAIDFGNLTIKRRQLAATSNGTYNRGIFGGGCNVIDYMTISTLGNAIDFGDLTLPILEIAATSNA